MLRPYQDAAVAAVQRGLGTQGSVLVSMGTGTGKTWVMAALAIRAARSGWRVLTLAHREELLDQAIRTYLKAGGARLPMGVVKGEREEWDKPIVVGSVQSIRGPRLERSPAFHLVITDEAHHSTTDSYQSIYQHLRSLYPNLRHVGMTATPYRSQSGGSTVKLTGFDELVFEYGLQEAMNDGWLVPEIRAVRIPTGHVINTRADHDLSVKGLNNPARNNLIVSTYRKLCPSAPSGLVFATNVLHAQELARLFRAAHVPAAAVWGGMKSEDRLAVIEGYSTGRIRLLVTVGVLTEGFDAPNTRVLVMARPTSSLVLWMQMLGRVTRPHPGKRMGVLLDFTDTVSSRIDLRPAGLGDVTPTISGSYGPYEMFRVTRQPAQSQPSQTGHSNPTGGGEGQPLSSSASSSTSASTQAS